MQEIYTQILELGRVSGAGSKFIRMSELYASGAWERTSAKLSFFTRPLSGGTVLDYGSKFGHLTPVLKSLGAARVINVDVDEEYLRDGEGFIGHINPAFLFTCFQEVARVMKPGAELVISDGNNLDLAEVKDGLMESWCQWEHGTSKELGSNYQAMRARMLAKAFPNLPED